MNPETSASRFRLSKRGEVLLNLLPAFQVCTLCLLEWLTRDQSGYGFFMQAIFQGDTQTIRMFFVLLLLINLQFLSLWFHYFFRMWKCKNGYRRNWVLIFVLLSTLAPLLWVIQEGQVEEQITVKQV